MFIWYKKLGILLDTTYPSSFARYPEGGSFEGPYSLWFKRQLGPIYWAVTQPKSDKGFTFL